MQNRFLIAAAVMVLVTAPSIPGYAQDNRLGDVAALGPTAPASARAFPNIDSLTSESDFTPFMAPDCPEELRQQALRRLWSLMPPTPVQESSAI